MLLSNYQQYSICIRVFDHRRMPDNSTPWLVFGAELVEASLMHVVGGGKYQPLRVVFCRTPAMAEKV